jgi:transcription elongation factor Elf1
MQEAIQHSAFMPDYEYFFGLLSEKSCPHCDQKTLHTNSEVELSTIGCVYCENDFQLTDTSLGITGELAVITEDLSQMICPACSHQGAVIQLHMNPESEFCHYFIGCPNCGRTHHQYL